MRNPSPLAHLVRNPESLQAALKQAKRTASELAETPETIATRGGGPIKHAGERLGIDPTSPAFGQAVGTPDGQRAAASFVDRINAGPSGYALPAQQSGPGGVA